MSADRITVLEAALRDVRQWVDHWDIDRRFNLAPTESSLQDALSIIECALASRVEPLVEMSPLSAYAFAAE